MDGALQVWSLIAAGALGVALKVGLQKWVEGRVTRQFNKELEDHRHQLSVEAERIKALYQSDIHNLSIVASRKHEVGRRMYYHACVAQGLVGGLFGAQTRLRLEGYSMQEIARYMSERRYSAASRRTVIESWEHDQKSALKELRAVDYLIQTDEAESRFVRANNFYLANALYLAEDVQEVATVLFGTLRLLILNARTPIGARPLDSIDLRDRSLVELIALRDVLKRSLGIELGSSSGRSLALGMNSGTPSPS